MSSKDKFNCSDPDLQRQVFRWALLKGNSELEPQDPLLAEHIRSCASCQAAVVEWKRKGVAWRLDEEARRIVRGEVEVGEQVDMKSTPSGKAFFRHPTAKGKPALLILVESDGHIQSVDATAQMADFELL